MLGLILMVCVAAAIAYPFVQKRLLLSKQPITAGEGAGDVAADVPAPTGIYTNAADAKKKREELCPHCSTLNAAGRRICVECKGDMPIVDMKEFIHSFGNEELMKEGVQAGLLLLAMVVAMLLANYLPIGGKIVVLLATIAALGYRLMNALHN